MYIDSHAHWSDIKVSHPDKTALLKKAEDMKITQFLLGGVDPADWKLQIELQKMYPEKFYLCFGLHPYFVSKTLAYDCEAALDELAQYLGSSEHSPLALGETGLDFRDKILESGELSKDEAISHQIDFFENQIQLAKAYKKPLVLHIVQAHEKALQVFDLWGAPAKGGLVHAFNGSFEIATKYIDLGMFISIGGAVTYEKNQKLRKTMAQIPLDALLLESDMPDQAPQGWQGPNDSSSLWQIAKVIGELRNLEPESVMEISTRNFKKLFSL